MSKFELKKFSQLVEKTFNSITVDSEMSTSDMVLLINVRENSLKHWIRLKKEFFRKLENLMEKLAQYIVKDGEGASKFITINFGAKITMSKTLPCLLLTHHFLKRNGRIRF